MKLLIFTALFASCYADISLLPPRQRHNPPQSTYNTGFLPPLQNSYVPPNRYIPPENTYLPPKTTPKPVYLPPSTTARPTTQYLPPSTAQPNNMYLPPQNTYLPPWNQKPVTPPVPILKQTNEIHEDGSFKYEVLTGDQTHIEQMGHIENPGTDHEEQVMHGSYSYVGPDGVTYKVTYVADGDGFRAIGDHLPTPPPIPEAIQKALDKIAASQSGYQYPAQPTGGYPSGPSGGYPSGPSGGYPSQRPDNTYIPPQNPTKPGSGYYY